MRTNIATVFTWITFLGIAALAGASEPDGLEGLARTALRASPEEATAAITGLRQAGPAGMETLLAASGSGDALDRVCGVRDCGEIRLFWYTDLEAAKAAARAQGRPILSLRLMGRLDEELSCANSRFFRTVFYKNSEINDLLRDRFVLHWRSVRPVPKVTIDFGDGTHLERTLTGNSIHYVLDSRGRLIEALPGLYGPRAFQSALLEAARAARSALHLNDVQFASWASARHREAQDPWKVSLPPARVELAASKSSGEGPILAALGVNDARLREEAERRRSRVHLDPASRDFLLRKHGVTDPKEAKRLVDSFESTVALDEVVNEYRTGPAILKKLSDPEVWKDFDLEAFNQWVYEDVFLTPLSDPWLGLAPEDVYVALPASARTAAPLPER